MKNYQLRQLFLGLLLLAATMSLMPANAFAATSEGQKPARQKQHRDDFIKEVKEMAIKKNRQVTQEKASLARFRTITNNGQTLSRADKIWVQKVVVRYQMSQLADKPMHKWTEREWRELLTKVDIVPVSIVVAQAAHESNFGQSNIAQQSNNLFGQKTPKVGYMIKCGTTTKSFKIFKSRTDSVSAYIDNINSCTAYREFRAARLACRDNDRCLQGLELIDHIASRYAEDKQYSKCITRLVNQYNMQKFDHIEI